MLSDVDIKRAMDEGLLKIIPFSPRQLRSAGITLHLGSALLKPIPGAIVDVKTGQLPEYEEIEITAKSPYMLKPQDFMLGHTFERITLSPKLGLFIEGRSTLARVGLTIVKTAMFVEPGHHNRTVTLELANHGPNVILLYPKMKIARVAIHELQTPSSRPYDIKGKYRNQNSVGKPIFRDEFMADN